MPKAKGYELMLDAFAKGLLLGLSLLHVPMGWLFTFYLMMLGGFPGSGGWTRFLTVLAATGFIGVAGAYFTTILMPRKTGTTFAVLLALSFATLNLITFANASGDGLEEVVFVLGIFGSMCGSSYLGSRLGQWQRSRKE